MREKLFPIFVLVAGHLCVFLYILIPRSFVFLFVEGRGE